MLSPVPAWLYLNPGDYLEARHVAEFARLLEERTYLPGYGCRMQYIPGMGAMIEAETQQASFLSVWHTSLSGRMARVGAGRVNTALPWLADDLGPLRPLDGQDEKGAAHPVGAPLLGLKPELFTDDGYSWIVVRVKIDPATGKMLTPQAGGLTIAQTNVVTWQDGGSIDVDGTGDHPVTMLRRPVSDTAGLGKITPNVYFNLQHRFVAGGEGQKGRHQFWV